MSFFDLFVVDIKERGEVDDVVDKDDNDDREEGDVVVVVVVGLGFVLLLGEQGAD